MHLWSQRMKGILLTVILIICVVGKSPVPEGHLKPLGSHSSQQSISVMTEFPTPHYFYEWFVKSSQPVIFKSVLNTIVYPAYKKWNDEYLRGQFGEQKVQTERGKKETRNINDIFSPTFNSFLEHYQNNDLYTVTELGKRMKEDIPMLPCLTCGGFQDALVKILMWFSSGGTKSVLHYDSMDNINCLLGGTKDLLFIDKIHKDRVEASGFIKAEGYSKVDVDKVDLLQFPQLENIPWLHAHMVKGDCLFIPRNWYHQVNSYGNRNLAVNVWFEHIFWFNQSDCDVTVKRDSYDAVSNYGVVSTELMDRLAIQEEFDGLSTVYIEDFYRRYNGTKEVADQVFSFLDSDGNGVITWDELNTLNMDLFKNNCEQLFKTINDEEENLEKLTLDDEYKKTKTKDEF